MAHERCRGRQAAGGNGNRGGIGSVRLLWYRVRRARRQGRAVLGLRRHSPGLGRVEDAGKRRQDTLSAAETPREPNSASRGVFQLQFPRPVDKLSQSPHGMALLILRSFRGLILPSDKAARGEDSPRVLGYPNHASDLNAYQDTTIRLASGIPEIRVDLIRSRERDAINDCP